MATDGTPAMVGTHEGSGHNIIVKKGNECKQNKNDKLVFCHCIVLKQILCAKSVKFDYVVLGVTDCINFIEKRDLNNRIFMQIFKDFDADHDDLHYYCAVRWTSRGNMFGRFYSVMSEIIEFTNLKKCSLTELEDEI